MCAKHNGLSGVDIERYPYCMELYGYVREFFDYLFDQYGFDLIYWEGRKAAPVCLLVLASLDCRSRFTFDRGVPQLSYGTQAAPITWHGYGKGEETVWYGLSLLLDFLENRPIRGLTPDVRDMKTVSDLRRISSQLKPHCDDLLHLMERDVPTVRQEESADYIENRREETLRHY